MTHRPFFLPIFPLMRIICTVLGLALCVVSQGGMAAEKTEVVQIDGVTKIKVLGPLSLRVSQGKASQLSITGSEADVASVLAQQDGDQLEISTRKSLTSWWSTAPDVQINAELPNVEMLEVVGSGDIVVGELSGQEISLQVQGSGDIQVQQLSSKELICSVLGAGDIAIKELVAATASVLIKGSGDVWLDGDVIDFDFNVVGSGDVNAERLSVGRVKGFLAGSGDVVILSAKEQNISTFGSGSFHLLKENRE